MKIIIGLLIGLLFYKYSQAEIYKYKNGLVIEAKTFKEASHKCFRTLTGNVYPGEEEGLKIIDICINPIKGKI